MYVTLVYVHVKPENVQDFIEASLANAHESVKEPGNICFDVLQMNGDPNRFVLYEGYASQDEAAAHKDTPHYQKWRETVADWMAEPRKGVAYEAVGQ